MVGIYCRISTAGQKDNYSLEVQEQQGIQFSNSIKDEYVIYKEQSSGGNIQRIELGNLQRDIEKRFIDKVWVIELSRLSRSIEDLQVLKNLFNKYGVDLYVGGQHYDLNKTDQSTMYNLIGVFAEHERAGTRDRMVRGKLADIDKGGRSVNMVYGYVHKYTEDGQSIWKIVPEEAEQIRHIFRLYLEGYTQRDIEQWLKEHHYKRRDGVPWHRSQISRLLKRLLYTGYTTDTQGNIIESTRYPAIIDYQDYVKCKEIAEYRTTNLTHSRRGTKRILYSCSNLIKCGSCGKGFRHRRAPTTKKKVKYNHYYYCQHEPDCSNPVKESFGKEYLDEIVINQTIIYLENWKNIERIYTRKINEIEDQSNEDKRDIDILRKQEKKVNTRYERLIDAIADGTITNEEAKPKLNKLRQEKEEIQNKIQEIEKKREEEKKEWDYILAKLSHDKIHELNWAYEDGDENQVSNILRSLIREGTFNNYNLHLEYITGDTYDIDVKNLPDLLYKRIYGLDILDDQT